MSERNVDVWHRLVKDRDLAGLDRVLADDAVFHSPIVHTPQVGKALTKLYLSAAFNVLMNGDFHYVREVASETDAVLEFETELDGVQINGVDMIRWNRDGQIVDFKVMLRPLKAIQLMHRMMGEMLERLKG
jgi:ketosteroid isomerase-like protein